MKGYYDVMFGILVNIVLRLLSTVSLLVVDPFIQSPVDIEFNMLAVSDTWYVLSPMYEGPR